MAHRVRNGRPRRVRALDSYHVQRGTMYNVCELSGFQFYGTITVRGAAHAVKGVGGLDHVVARNVGSKSSPGVGFWHYDPIHWGNGLISNGLYYLGVNGEPYITQGVMTLPDGGYHPAGRFAVEYLELGEGTANAGATGGPQVVPRRWKATMEAAHGPSPTPRCRWRCAIRRDKFSSNRIWYSVPKANSKAATAR